MNNNKIIYNTQVEDISQRQDGWFGPCSSPTHVGGDLQVWMIRPMWAQARRTSTIAETDDSAQWAETVLGRIIQFPMFQCCQVQGTAGTFLERELSIYCFGC